MKNNLLPIKKENSFLRNIKVFFKSLFYKEKDDNVIYQSNIKKMDNSKNQFQEKMKSEIEFDFANEIQREEFLDNIEKNPNILYELSVDRLKKLEKYYQISIKKLEEKLVTIKRSC